MTSAPSSPSSAKPPKVARRQLNRPEIIAILEKQGADLSTFVMPKDKGGREKQIWNAIEDQGIIVPCGACRAPIARRQDCIRDHTIPLRSIPEDKRADYDKPWNQRYLCHVCNGTKTHKRGLNGLGSDAARLAKLRRIEKKSIAPQEAKKPWPTRTIPTMAKPTIPSRAFPQSNRPIPSRPFPKRKKTIDGEK